MAVWHGLRVTLGCGHMKLAEAGSDIRIGQLSACWICPKRPSPGGGDMASSRHVVDLAGIDAPSKPDPLPPETWF